MATYYAQHEWEPWSLESYRRIAQGLDPNTGGQAYDAYNNQPVYSDAQRQHAQSLVDQMEKAGVNYSFQLQGLPAPIKQGGTFGSLLKDFVTSPAFLTLAGGTAGVYGAGAGAAGAGAEGGSGAALADASWGVNPTTEALGSGITTGATGASGLSTTATGASGLSTTGATGSLAPGFFAAESAYPVAGGLTAATTGGNAVGGNAGAGGAPQSAAQQTAIQKILDGTATTQDYVTLFGQVAPSLLGMYASDKQADALKGLSGQFMGMGQPYRDRLGALYSDPTAFLKSPEVQVPVQLGTDALARSLSTQGNPAGSGAALQHLQSYASDQLFGRLGQEKDRLAGFGGLASYNAAAPQVASGAIDANRGFYDSLGYGIGQVTNPPRSLQDILKSYNISQGLA